MKSQTTMERFLEKIQINKTSECWEWVASKFQNGYGQFKVGDKNYKAHRFSYEMLVGPIPEDMQIDHICHVKTCVNPSHLRPCTRSENRYNSLRHKDNKSGYKGVCWHKSSRKWHAHISFNGRRIYLGDFSNPVDAYAAFCEAALKYHGEFANFGELT